MFCHNISDMSAACSQDGHKKGWEEGERSGGRRARCVGSESDSLELVYTFHQPVSQLKKHAFPSLPALAREVMVDSLLSSGSARCSKGNEHGLRKEFI